MLLLLNWTPIPADITGTHVNTYPQQVENITIGKVDKLKLLLHCRTFLRPLWALLCVIVADPFIIFHYPSVPTRSVPGSTRGILGRCVLSSSSVHVLLFTTFLIVETYVHMLLRKPVLPVKTSMYVIPRTPVLVVDILFLRMLFCLTHSYELTLTMDLGQLIFTYRVLSGIPFFVAWNLRNVAPCSGLVKKSA